MYFQNFQLKDAGDLPPNCTIKDPLDGRYFHVPPKAKLDDLIQLFQYNRRNMGAQEPSKEYLEPFIIAQLVEQTNANDRRKYFQPLKTLPTTSQILSFARTVAAEFVNGDVIGVIKRQQRAQQCLKCPLHRKGSSIPPRIPSVFEPPSAEQKQSGLAVSYPEEDQLGTCGMCGCALKSKVKFHIKSTLVGISPENIDKILTFLAEKAFATCWILGEALEGADTKKLLRDKMRNGTRQGEQLLKKFLDERGTDGQ